MLVYSLNLHFARVGLSENSQHRFLSTNEYSALGAPDPRSEHLSFSVFQKFLCNGE